MNYNKKMIMDTAWKLCRYDASSFGTCLHKAWENAKSYKQIAEDANCEVHTWYEWKQLGKEVKHGEKCAYQAIMYDTTKSGMRVTSFFTEAQV